MNVFLFKILYQLITIIRGKYTKIYKTKLNFLGSDEVLIYHSKLA